MIEALKVLNMKCFVFFPVVHMYEVPLLMDSWYKPRTFLEALAAGFAKLKSCLAEG